jgi:hypothetical protein
MYTFIISSIIFSIVSASSYDISALSSAEKQVICVKNLAFCTNTCNNQTAANTCDASTMQFTCACSTGPLPVSLHYFPIQAQQCVGEDQDCRNACVANDPTGANVINCSNECDIHFNCGTPSAGETKNFSPDPNLTKSTGSSADTQGTISNGTASVSTTPYPNLGNSTNSTNWNVNSTSGAHGVKSMETAGWLGLVGYIILKFF